MSINWNTKATGYQASWWGTDGDTYSTGNIYPRARVAACPAFTLTTAVALTTERDLQQSVVGESNETLQTSLMIRYIPSNTPKIQIAFMEHYGKAEWDPSVISLALT